MNSNEVSKLLNIPISTLHYYEKAGLLSPNRNVNGYREYQQSDVENMKLILFLKEMKFSLQDIQIILFQFDRLIMYKNLGEYDDALSFFLSKKQEFSEFIKLYQLAITIIDMIFENHQKKCSKKEKEQLIQQIQNLINRFWQLRNDMLDITNENLF